MTAGSFRNLPLLPARLSRGKPQLTKSSVTFYGLPHPATQAVFMHLQSIVAAIMGEAATAAWNLVTNPWINPDDGGQNYLLLSEAMSSLALTAAANAPAPPAVSVRHALAARCERRWQHLPTLSIETTLQDPSATARWLSDEGLIACDGRALQIIRDATWRLRPQRELLVDPVTFFQQISEDEAHELLLTPLDRLLTTGRGGDGLPSLAQGWREPETELCRLHSPIGTLRLLLPPDASVLHCFCSEEPHVTSLVVYVDGVSVPGMISGESRRELHIPLPHRYGCDLPAVVTVEFVEERAGDVAGFGLTGFIIIQAPRLSGGIAERALPDALAAAGFAPIGDTPPDSPNADGTWLETLAAHHRPAKLLILSEDASGMLQRLQLKLDTVTLVAASTAPASVDRPPACGPIFHADLAGLSDWPVIGRVRFDLIHLQQLARFPQLTTRLRWLARHLSYRGILSGCEQNVEDARHVVSELGRGIDQRFLTFVLEGSRWRAIPHSHWRA